MDQLTVDFGDVKPQDGETVLLMGEGEHGELS